MSLFTPAPPPPTKLGRYRLLSPKAGVHVSPIQLGAMSIGDRWQELGMGAMNKEDSFKLLDAYFDMGGNFIDTSNNYQDGSSEMFIGEWAEKRGIRDQLFIATKYGNNPRQRDPNQTQKVLYIGNSAKSMHLAVGGSLKNLRSSYIDLLYVHFWDWDTSVEEVMGSLHTLVLQGKVLYLGISDTPAWVVAKANQYARDHALTPFSVYQGLWNVAERSLEREILPMARDEGMAIAPWAVLGGGKIRTDAEEEKRRQTGEKGRLLGGPNWERNERERAVCLALEKVTEEVGAKSMTAVAIAYLLHKAPFVFPVIGGRKVEHLVANLEALDISLTQEQIKFIESVIPFHPGFPQMLYGDGTNYSFVFAPNAHVDKLPYRQPLTAKKQ